MFYFLIYLLRIKEISLWKLDYQRTLKYGTNGNELGYSELQLAFE